MAGLFVGRRTPERCLSLFVSKGAVLVERPVGGTSVTTTVSSEAVPDLLAERFEISGVIVGSDGRFTPRA